MRIYQKHANQIVTVNMGASYSKCGLQHFKSPRVKKQPMNQSIEPWVSRCGMLLIGISEISTAIKNRKETIMRNYVLPYDHYWKVWSLLV